MNFQQLINERYSVRLFRTEKVPDVLIRQVIEAGRLAPSACNNQPWTFIVINEPEMLDAIREAYPREWFKKAPQIIIVCTNHQQSWKRPYDGKDHSDIDAAIATSQMTLMATELGLGTCWVCHFNAEKVKLALQLPPHIEPVVLLPIGYPNNGKPLEKQRKPLDTIIHYNCFEEK
jgi:nitroreductase